MTAVLPLACVLLLSMIRDGVEDYSRHKTDKRLNNSKCLVLEIDKNKN